MLLLLALLVPHQVLGDVGGGGGDLPAERQNSTTCQPRPLNVLDPKSPASTSTLHLNCQADFDYDSCFFFHRKPWNFNEPSSHDMVMCFCVAYVIRVSILYLKDFECGSVAGTRAKQCADDPRIVITTTRNTCELRITNPDPDDTGLWKVKVGIKKIFMQQKFL